MTAATGTAIPRANAAGAFGAWWRRNTWTIGLLVFLATRLSRSVRARRRAKPA